MEPMSERMRSPAMAALATLCVVLSGCKRWAASVLQTGGERPPRRHAYAEGNGLHPQLPFPTVMEKHGMWWDPVEDAWYTRDPRAHRVIHPDNHSLSDHDTIGQ